MEGRGVSELKRGMVSEAEEEEPLEKDGERRERRGDRGEGKDPKKGDKAGGKGERKEFRGDGGMEERR